MGESGAAPHQFHVRQCRRRRRITWADITWGLFRDPQTNLLGGWTHDGDTLVFQQWNTMSEARNQEQLSSYRGRHTEVGLWGFTSTLSDVLGAMSHEPLSNDAEGQPHSDAPERAEQPSWRRSPNRPDPR